MSLTGNLEDLPLLDILQIVSFSKKTGYLSIRTSAGEGAIVFSEGLVVASFTWDSLPVDPRLRSLPPEKRSVILRQRIELALEHLIRLREGQFNFSLAEKTPTRVGARDIVEETLATGINPQELLLELARGMDEERRDSTAAIEASFAEAPEAAAEAPAAPAPEERAAVESAEEEVVETELELQPDEPEPPPLPPGRPADAPPPDLTLRETSPDEGPQTLRIPVPFVMPPAAVAPPPPPAPPTPAAAAGPASATGAGGRPCILLVDDEPDVRRILGEHFMRAGHPVVEAEDPDSGVKQAAKLSRSSTPFLVVADLGMPTSGGSSFQGGFELVKRMAKMHLRPPVLLMAETLRGSLQSRARQLGIRRVVFKPSLSKLDPPQFEADLRAFARKLLADVLPQLGPVAAAPPAAPARPGESSGGGRPPAERKAPPPPPPAPAPVPLAPAPSAVAPPPRTPAAGERTIEELSRELETLQRRLEDLRRGGDATQVSALVMEVAREFFERGILFLVKNQQARGLGGFGLAPGDENLNLLAREVAIPLAEPSIFQDVVGRRRPHWGALPDGKWTEYLLGRIGRFKSGSAALIPLLTHRETIAVLFGDNPETGRPPGRLDSLEVFINQAGIALENAFLQRKLRALQGREVS
jgi:CheY-like chemotaxis protein